jgi:hypothetical protein
MLVDWLLAGGHLVGCFYRAQFAVTAGCSTLIWRTHCGLMLSFRVMYPASPCVGRLAAGWWLSFRVLLCTAICESLRDDTVVLRSGRLDFIHNRERVCDLLGCVVVDS